MRRAALVALCCVVLPCLALAQARVSVLGDVLRIAELSKILSDEGAEYGRALDREMLGGEGGSGFHAMVAQIYAPEKIAEGIRQGLEQHVSGEELEETVEFFASGLGGQILTLEMSARVAFADKATEETARARFIDLADTDPERHALIVRMMDAGDLVQRNVTATMNAELQYYRGLIDGDMIEMSEEDILSAVTLDLEQITEDTKGWLGGFMTLAYSPLSNAEIAVYVEFSESDAGLALNRGFFSGFDPLYEDISYALGRAIALNITSEKL